MIALVYLLDKFYRYELNQFHSNNLVIGSMIKLIFTGKEVPYQVRERYRWLIVLTITGITIMSSLLITYLVLILTNNPLLPIVFIIAALVPAIISPITTWAISGLIVKTQKLEEAYRQIACYDYLTGLLTRRAFIEQGEGLLQQCVRKNRSLSLAFLDLDKFKRVNDVYGHAGGDKVLETFAQLMKDAIRSSDIVGRLGGEEFAILLPDTNLEYAEGVLEKIKQKLVQTQIAYLEHTITITVSIGLTDIQNRIDIHFSDLLQQADNALYKAKESGRNRIVTSEEK
ncbi:GGDEF domain-containing protein [Paraglaciecola aquimarina]|uniref:diguanylate cyclase n=1 Tax=Paraglaciecola aquimarina TaxID=1235557 RepID=A0ABU3SUN3_9ALTE|nr:GGDEF domain-containing protein [Paraglaciecola aquimarina]MDU0353709.1 GGDEF domain-containing protein [Paraglaciecola aquimarina]